MSYQKKSILDSDRIGPLLFKLALPSFIGMFVITLYNVVNTIFIGHFVGYLGIAGLSIVFPFQMLGLGLGQMTGVGGASLISRLIGARNNTRAARTLGNAFALNIAVALAMTWVGLSNPDFWLRLAGASDTVLPYARDYMIIIFSGMIFNIFSMSANSLTLSQGHARVTMAAQILGALLNIILDSIFIIGFKWGVRGAAIGTVIAQTATTVFFLVFYLRGHSYLKIHAQDLVPDFGVIKEIMFIGVTPLAMTLATSISSMYVNNLLESYGSDVALSTMGIMGRLMMFGLMPSIVIGQGLQPILGFNYGAKRFDRILRGIKIATFAATATSLAAFLVFYFFPQPFIYIFTGDPNLVSLGSYAIRRAFFFIYLVGFINVNAMIFVALGKATQSFIISVFRNAVFMIPIVTLFGRIWQLEGIWLSFPACDALSFGLVLIFVIPLIRDLRRKRLQENTAIATASKKQG